MSWRWMLSAAAVVCLVFAGGGRPEVQGAQSAPAPPKTDPTPTADIQAGVERHLENQVRRGGGYFKLTYRNQELRLQLVKVHTSPHRIPL